MKKITTLSVLFCLALTGCQTTGQAHRSDTYTTGSVNQKAESKTIEIIDIRSANVAVDNTEQKESAQKTAMLIGGIAGAVIGNSGGGSYRDSAIGAGAGALAGSAVTSGVKDTVMVEGVQLTYLEEVIEDKEDVVDGKRVMQVVKTKKTYTSAQVGQMCEFQNGVALMVTTSVNETRIQPNSQCIADSGKAS